MKQCLRVAESKRRQTLRSGPLPSLVKAQHLNLLKRLTLALLAAALFLRSVGLAQQSAPAKPPAVSRISQIVMEDQAENPGNTTEAQVIQHGIARRAEVRKLLADGKIVTSEDLSQAALIFQHGQTPDDFLFAHILAVEALTKDPSADKWLAAATLD